jgi:hypothetical protein
VARLTTTTNTVYYVVGKEEDLIKKGVVKKEGSKFLFFGGTVAAALRGNLTPENFTAVDKTQELVIPMPASDKEYKVISRQNLAFADSTDLDDGKVKGGQLHIMSPDQFWAGSSYLILVED